MLLIWKYYLLHNNIILLKFMFNMNLKWQLKRKKLHIEGNGINLLIFEMKSISVVMANFECLNNYFKYRDHLIFPVEMKEI